MTVRSLLAGFWLPFVLVFAHLVSLGFHGFSLSAWRDVIEGDGASRGAPELVLGQPRHIRSDEWMINLPRVFSQLQRSPRFPVTVAWGPQGLQQDMVHLQPAVPARHWTTLFKPQVWGYFAGADFGMAWQWWFRVFALFGAAYFWFLHLMPGRRLLAGGFAAALAASPFYVYWSFGSEPLTAAALALMLAVLSLWRRDLSAAAVAGWGALALWAGGVLLISVFYPPFQIVLGLFVASMLISEAPRSLTRKGLVLTLAVGAAGLALGAVYLWEGRQIFASLAASAYPGERRSSGGDLGVNALSSSLFTIFFGNISMTGLGNVCEAASFLFLMPALGWTWLRRERRAWALLALLAILFVWSVIGLPALIARPLLLDRVPGPRVLPALGLAAFSLLALDFATNAPARGRGFWLRLGGFAVALGLAGWHLRAAVPNLKAFHVPLLVAALSGLQAGFLARRRWAVPLLALLTCTGTFWFNPLARGGSEYFFENPLAQALRRQSPAGSVWAVYGPGRLGNLPHGLGLASLNGHCLNPDFTLWRQLDPRGEHQAVYNRMHALLLTIGAPGRPEFYNPRPDTVLLAIHPDDAALAAVGVNRLLFVGDEAQRPELGAAWHRLENVGASYQLFGR